MHWLMPSAITERMNPFPTIEMNCVKIKERR